MAYIASRYCDLSELAGYALTEGDALKRPTYQQLLFPDQRCHQDTQLDTFGADLATPRGHPRPDDSLVARPLGPTDLASSGLLLLTNRPALRKLGGAKDKCAEYYSLYIYIIAYTGHICALYLYSIFCRIDASWE